MRKYRKNTLTSNGVYLKKRIARVRRRAKLVGFIYLIATIALAAVACLPLLVHDLAPVGATEFYKTFLNMDLKTPEGLIKLANSALYALLLLAVVINVFKSLGKLGWLCKKKGSKTFGFNRNAYAMDDMGRIFSGSLAAIINVYFLIAILCGSLTVNMMMIIAVGGGLVVHLLCGFIGAKIAYFDCEKDGIVEEKRVIGRFAPLFRNVLQIATVAAIVYFFDYAAMNAKVVTLLSAGGISELLGDLMTLAVFAAQAVIALCTLVLVKHATATTEYNFEGRQGAGMKNFRIFTFFTFLAAAGIVAVKYLLIADKVLDMNALIIAGVAFVMFVIELIMRKMPKVPGDAKKLKKNAIVEDEFSFDAFTRAQQVQQSQLSLTAPYTK